MKQWYVLPIVIVQVICTAFFVGQILSSVLGLAPLAWHYHELIELGAAVGLLSGVVLGWIVLRRTLAHHTRMHDQLRLASGAFRDVMDERFAEWGLTPAERDVALFAIKGLSLQDIASLRNVSEGTIKAQTNAIYRKAGVTGRTQLLSVFIDELMIEPV